VCGFVGRNLAERLLDHGGFEVFGIDNLTRAGSESNRLHLLRRGVTFRHGDIRLASDVEECPDVDWVIDAAANPSVLAGRAGSESSRQLLEHNLWGTVNLLEFCKRTGAGLVVLSTSRVYSIPRLADLAVEAVNDAFRPREESAPPGLTSHGVDESFPAEAPMSLYGATKRSSEILALEYGSAFGFPVWIDRCGVLAGAGQFARADQGIFSFWLHRWNRRRPLRYIGFGGSGHQVRDCLHPVDVADLVRLQVGQREIGDRPQVVNVSGGGDSACSLAQLTAWCRERFGAHEVGVEPEERPYDLPWVVLDARLAGRTWAWRPERSLLDILEEIARHAESEPEWLEMTGGD
jgi:CDP-paratose 2-epimerase